MKKKKRLLFLIPTLDFGGAQIVLLRLLRYLNREKYEIGLLLLRNEGESNLFASIPKDIQFDYVYELSSPKRRLRYDFIPTLLKIVKKAFYYDVVIGSLELYPTFLSYFAARLLRKKTVGWVHIAIEPYLNYWNIGFFNKLARYVYPKLDAVVFVSEGAAQSMKTFLKKKRIKNRSVIYNIVDIKSSGSDELYKTNNQGKIVLAVGRLVSQKGFDILIKAHAQLIKRNIDHRLVIVGEGVLHDYLLNLTRDLGVADSVHFEGYVEDPTAYFREASVFVLSSRFEGLGMVILEALMAGVPIVSTDCPYGPSEILEKGKYGLLVRPEDSDALADAIQRLLTDIDLRNEFKKLAPSRVADFLPYKIIKQWDNLFESI